ncbi:MAG TPA: PilT/PilU family type 4a pilus ATPase, partial [Candidatus Acidoferrales bacterium]|nr:PilT/PilU family type 4a pilus ATPase [Candidatus Acidoferrales bacterium]
AVPTTAAAAPAPPVSTPVIIATMLRAAPKISDLIFSPGRAPQVEVNGELVQLKIPGVGVLKPDDTARIAVDLMGGNKLALDKLREEGSCDISYSVPKLSRFRVNIFTQRGTCGIVMRVIPTEVPDFKSLNLPAELNEAAELRPGIVLVTGPTGSGKSSTLAAFVGKINQDRACHIITIEDPIEFLHRHNKATIHQRELHTDCPSFALALRAALRQAPKLILVGEMRDKQTIEVALEAAETGHMVYSTLHTIDASKTVERIIGVFPLEEQNAIRGRLAKSFRYIISQRLIPRLDGTGRAAAFEILKATVRTREYVQKGEAEGKSLLDAMRDAENGEMQCFDDEIEKMIRAGVIDMEVGLSYCTNIGNLRLCLADFVEAQGNSPTRARTLKADSPAPKSVAPSYAGASGPAPAESSEKSRAMETEIEIER